MDHLTEHDLREITIFRLELDLIEKLEHEGHTSRCAIWLVVGKDEGGADECTCASNEGILDRLIADG